jgi:ABC-type transporter Mla subunit MlaD
MARKARNEVAVGITTLVVLALAVYIVVMLADWSELFAAHQQITVRLPYKVGLKGLNAGSPVQLGGVKIGQITHTWIGKAVTAEPGMEDVYVFFTMKIPKRYQLYRDCRLTPHSNVLGGQASLYIEDLGRQGKAIMDGETVDVSLGESVMEVIRREFDSEDPNSILALVKYEADRENTDSLVSSLKNAAAQAEKGIAAVSEELQRTLAKAQSALDTAEAALENLKGFTDDERIDKIITNISEVSVNLKLTSREVRRAPWKLLYKPKEKEVRIQAVVDSAGAFAAGAEQLDSAAMRLQRLLGEADEQTLIDREQIQMMVSELQTSFEQFQKAEKKFWKQLE